MYLLSTIKVFRCLAGHIINLLRKFIPAVRLAVCMLRVASTQCSTCLTPMLHDTCGRRMGS
jgi:hypothetical protein